MGAELGYDLGYYHEASDETSTHAVFQLDFRGKVHYILHGFRGGIVIQF